MPAFCHGMFEGMGCLPMGKHALEQGEKGQSTYLGIFCEGGPAVVGLTVVFIPGVQHPPHSIIISCITKLLGIA